VGEVGRGITLGELGRGITLGKLGRSVPLGEVGRGVPSRAVLVLQAGPPPSVFEGLLREGSPRRGGSGALAFPPTGCCPPGAGAGWRGRGPRKAGSLRGAARREAQRGEGQQEEARLRHQEADDEPQLRGRRGEAREQAQGPAPPPAWALGPGSAGPWGPWGRGLARRGAGAVRGEAAERECFTETVAATQASTRGHGHGAVGTLICLSSTGPDLDHLAEGVQRQWSCQGRRL